MVDILQCVWPIVDDTYTLSELITEATTQLDQLAERAHCHITGPPQWVTADAADVPGWTAYAPSLVLIARVPAEATPSLRSLGIRAGHVVDDAAVERALAGDPTALQRRADRVEAVRRLRTDGLADRVIAAKLRMTVDAVKRIAVRHALRSVA